MRRAEHRRAKALRGRRRGMRPEPRLCARATVDRGRAALLRAAGRLDGRRRGVRARAARAAAGARRRPRARACRAITRVGRLRPAGASRCCATGRPALGAAPLVFTPYVLRLLRWRRVDLLRGHSVRHTGPALLLGRALARSRVPVVLHHHHLYPRWARLEAAIARRADAVVTVSEHSRRELVAAGVPAERVHVVLEGIAAPPPTGGWPEAWPGPGCGCSTSAGSRRASGRSLAIDTLAALRRAASRRRWSWPARARWTRWRRARPASRCGSPAACRRGGQVAALRQRRRAALRLDPRGLRARRRRGAVARRAGRRRGRDGHRRGARRRRSGLARAARRRGVRRGVRELADGGAAEMGAARGSSRAGSTGTRARRAWPTSTAASCGEGAVLDRLGAARGAARGLAADVRGLRRAARLRAVTSHRSEPRRRPRGRRCRCCARR